MANPPFDASKAVTFDLSRGQIQKDDEPRLLISAGALLRSDLPSGCVRQNLVARAVASAGLWGIDAGEDPAVRESIAAHVAELAAPCGSVAIAGFGTLSAERWGRALVLVVDRGTGGAEGDRLLGVLLGSAVSKATKVEARCVQLARDGDRVRFLVCGPRGADKVREWLAAGVSWGEALVRLHPSSGKAGMA